MGGQRRGPPRHRQRAPLPALAAGALRLTPRPPCPPGNDRSAPRPSWALVLPVSAFILMALFIAVYWPAGAKPDGGIAVMDGAGACGAGAARCCLWGMRVEPP